MLGDHAQRRGRAAADHDRRVRPLDRLGVAERSGQLVVGAVEVERLGLGPQAPDDRARFGEAPDRVLEVVDGRPCASYSRRADGWPGREPTPMPKSSLPPETSRRSRRSWRASPAGESGCWSPAPRGADARSRGEGREQRPAFEDRPVRVAADRHEVVKQPHVLDLRDRVRFAPDPQYVLVATCCGAVAIPKVTARLGVGRLISMRRARLNEETERVPT